MPCTPWQQAELPLPQGLRAPALRPSTPLSLSLGLSKLNWVTSKDPKWWTENSRRLRKGAPSSHLLLSLPRAHSEMLKEAQVSLRHTLGSPEAMGTLAQPAPCGSRGLHGLGRHWPQHPWASAEPDSRALVRIHSQGSASPGGHRLPLSASRGLRGQPQSRRCLRSGLTLGHAGRCQDTGC